MPRRAFTLIELLVVISIIALILAIAAGAMVSRSRRVAGDLKCMAEMHGAAGYISSWMDDDIHRYFPQGHYEDDTLVPFPTSVNLPCRVTEWDLPAGVWRCARRRADPGRWSDRLYIAPVYMWNFRSATWDPPLATRVYAQSPDAPLLEDADYWHDGRGVWVSYSGVAGFFSPDE